jgi:ABC-type multidrug transport system fused ATPase/permease subunit
LSSATISQKVLFLENGKLVEMGTHEQLMENGGPYSRLFTMQAKRYIADKQKTEDREIL